MAKGKYNNQLNIEKRVASRNASLPQPQDDIKQKASQVNQIAGPQMGQLMAEAAPEALTFNKEQLADLDSSVRAELEPLNQQIAAAATDEEAASLVDRKKAIIAERAKIGERGLSTGERIALAILSSAPLIASAFRGDSNYQNAAQASQQIRKGFVDANEQQKATEMEQKDVELAQLNKEEAMQLRTQEQEQERAFMRQRDKEKFGYDVALERERQKGQLSAEARKKDERVVKAKKYIINEINKDPLAKDAAKAVKQFSQFYDVVDNEDGFGDFMASYAAGKLGDPATGIRDAERTDLLKAGGFLEQLKNTPNKFMRGGQFTPEAREKFKRAMDDAVSIHYKYLNQGINNKVNALMSVDPSLREVEVSPEELIQGTAFDKRNLLSEKAQSIMDARELAREKQRYEELKRKAGRK